MRHDRLCEALGHKAAVGLLGYLENQIVHCRNISPLTCDPQQPVAPLPIRVEGRRGDQLIPRLGEPEAKPEIASGQMGRLSDRTAEDASPQAN